jgi:hypothetical protein
VVVPELTGALEGLAVLTASDLARYKAAVAAGRQTGWGYYFPFLLTRNRPGRSAVLMIEDEGSVCVFLWRLRNGRPHLDLHVAPAPMNVPVLARCLERANDYNGDFSARVMRVDTKDVPAVSSIHRLHVRQRKMQYLYRPNSYADLSGSRYYTIRRNVARVRKLPDVVVAPYSASHAQACRELLRRWRSHHRQVHGTGGGASISRRALQLAALFGDTDMRGEVILLDGRLVAFAFGGEISPGVGCIFETKTNIEVQGISYFQRLSLISRLADFELVNDGSDTGRKGLRQLKDSFRPVEMHAEYRAFQRSLRPVD